MKNCNETYTETKMVVGYSRKYIETPEKFSLYFFKMKQKRQQN